jgi:hypothetical protein
LQSNKALLEPLEGTDPKGPANDSSSNDQE